MTTEQYEQVYKALAGLTNTVNAMRSAEAKVSELRKELNAAVAPFKERWESESEDMRTERAELNKQIAEAEKPIREEAVEATKETREAIKGAQADFRGLKALLYNAAAPKPAQSQGKNKGS